MNSKCFVTVILATRMLEGLTHWHAYVAWCELGAFPKFLSSTGEEATAGVRVPSSKRLKLEFSPIVVVIPTNLVSRLLTR